MKKLKTASREQLNQEYYQLAATAGDLQMNIKHLRRRLENALSSMSVLIKRIEGMPMPSAPEDGGKASPVDEETAVVGEGAP